MSSRIQGDKPIYLPSDSLFTQKLVMDAHLTTLHGGVGLTMTYIRENYWIPCLRQLAKKVRSSCYGCKRHQVRALLKVKPAPLPTDRTTGWRPFQEVDVTEIEEKDLRKRAKYLKKCKDDVWRRWRDGYLRGLRERHNLTHNLKENTLKVGDVMMIKGEEKNRSKWKIGIVTELIIGRDGLVRGAKLRAGRDHLERAVEHLYPMELSCDEVVPEIAEEAPTTRPK